ncbi:MAG TPA: hypothetical protein VHH54_02840 [Actinomycetota bacterium]|nr:hypothetical protein [Actinomycetota bacterium]
MQLVAGLLALMLLSGCDGGPTPSRQDSPRAATTGEEEGEEALREIPPEDRLAVVQIGAAAGNLRSSAALIRLQDVVRRRDTATLRRLRQNVRSLRPRDLLLQQLRALTIKQLGRAIRARSNLDRARRSVRSTLRGVDEIVDGLRAYVYVHPEAGGLVPE